MTRCAPRQRVRWSDGPMVRRSERPTVHRSDETKTEVGSPSRSQIYIMIINSLSVFILSTIVIGIQSFHSFQQSRVISLQSARSSQLMALSSLDRIERAIKATAYVMLSLVPSIVSARPEGVNKPELLPKDYTPIIDVANFLT